jgi:hypothetical protein
MKRTLWYYARYILAGLLLYIVFGIRERMTVECPVGQSATRDSDTSPWRCMCNDPKLTLVDGLCVPPPTVRSSLGLDAFQTTKSR